MDRSTRIWLCTITGAVLIFAAGCSGGTGGDQETSSKSGEAAKASASGETAKKGEKPASLKVAPAELTLSPGDSYALDVKGVFAGGAERALAPDAALRIASSAPEVAGVDGTGHIAVSPGAHTGDTATLTAEAYGLRAEVKLTVLTPLSRTVTADADGDHTVTNPTDLVVVVNKARKLPDGYAPDDLTEPNVPFSFSGKNERRLMRKTAASALEELFKGAKKDKIELAGVSGYRSYRTQVAVFQGNVSTQGKDEASRYSAVPGHSEHQTGLAIDVSSRSAGYALEEKFGNTTEGKWLAAHAYEYGFIIRYPKGKEAVTGYSYEPWHIRYVGKNIAAAIHDKSITLEEYFEQGVPAVKQ